MVGAQELAPALGVAAACRALGLWPGALKRHQARMHRVSFVGPLARRAARPRPPLALAACEQAMLLETLNSERFADTAPAAVYARAYCQTFFPWYNMEHRHSGIGYMTPHSVHYGHAKQLRCARATTLEAAFRAYPNRFKGRCPQPPTLPTAVWINPPPKEIAATQNQQPCTVNL